MRVTRLLLLACASFACSSAALAQETTRCILAATGLTRSCYVHVPFDLPSDKPAPLVFIFHGSGGNGAGMESFTQFSALANREGFIAVYPDAVALNWNDGRNANSIPSQAQHVDDVAFVTAMIRELEGRRAVDPKRIFAAGFSNGGIFVHYLANELSSRFAAIADVSGGIAEPLASSFNPKAHVSVFMIHGTADPFVPFTGGDVDYGGFGRIISIPQTAEAWKKVNALGPKPENGSLPDKVIVDECLVKWSKWTGGKKDGELLLYTIEGGGHAWPGGPQFQPVSVIGHVCRDFDATVAIWEFFKKHPRM